MTIKILQLNIFQGKFIERVIEFVRENNIDMLHFQEVTGGALSRGGGYTYNKGVVNSHVEPIKEMIGINCVETIMTSLNYESRFVKTMTEIDDPNSYYGVATFFKHEFKVLEEKIVELNPEMAIGKNFTDWEKIGRSALLTKLEKDGKIFWSINTHFAWGDHPRDEQYKIDQAKKLYRKIEKIKEPFVFTGDFNVIGDTETASMFSDFATNLTVQNNITNTLNPRMHPAQQLFPPGLAVDFIFVSKGIIVKSFRLVDEIDLSDHFGLLLEFEV